MLNLVQTFCTKFYCNDVANCVKFVPSFVVMTLHSLSTTGINKQNMLNLVQTLTQSVTSLQQNLVQTLTQSVTSLQQNLVQTLEHSVTWYRLCQSLYQVLL
jgi:uncharacterized membrane protein (Fun14 family)